MANKFTSFALRGHFLFCFSLCCCWFSCIKGCKSNAINLCQAPGELYAIVNEVKAIFRQELSENISYISSLLFNAKPMIYARCNQLCSLSGFHQNYEATIQSQIQTYTHTHRYTCAGPKPRHKIANSSITLKSSRDAGKQQCFDLKLSKPICYFSPCGVCVIASKYVTYT